jgi:hypothetical protein
MTCKNRPTTRRNRVGLGILALATSLLLYLNWPSAFDWTQARIKQLGGTVIIEPDEDGEEARNVTFILRPVTDQDLSSLKGLSEIRHLRLFLDDTKVTDDGLKQLSAYSDLRTLSLCNTRITDQGLGYVAQCPHLQRLSLRYCHVTDVGLGRLAALRGLKTLDVQETRVSPAGVARLQKALPGLRVWHVVADND